MDIRLWCRQCWRDHSLNIVLTTIGLVAVAVAMWLVWPLSVERWFDILSGLGIGCLTVALFYGLAGRFRERNKPEEPPK
jgi:thiol:disulfide interchange protein